MKKIFWTLLLLAGPVLLYGQTGLGTAGQQEYARALTNGGRFGQPRYTTALLPTCNSSNLGALAYDTTAALTKVCTGAAWANVGSGAGAGVTIGAAVTGGTANRVIFEDAGNLLAQDADFTFATDTLTVTKIALAADVLLTREAAAAFQLGLDSTAGSTVDQTLKGADTTTQTDAAGSDFTLAAGRGTGTGVSVLNFAVPTPQGTGTTAQVLFNAMQVKNIGTSGTPLGIAYVYKVSDSATEPANYERLEMGSLGAVFGIYTRAGGSGVTRQLDIGTVGASAVTLFTTNTTRMTISAAGFVDSAVLGMTAGTMVRSLIGGLRDTTHSFTWTNAQVVTALAGTGDILAFTAPAKTEIIDFKVVINTAALTSTTLTVACGRTGATYIDYIVASDAKAAANTVYGDMAAERGTNLTGYDLPSYTGTTAVNCNFVKTGADPTASTGTVIVTTRLLP